MAAGELVVQADDQVLTIVAPDRPGLLSRVTGVLALHGLDVLSAQVHSDDDGMALEVLRVESSLAPLISWDKVVADLRAALEGRLALTARLAQRARTYGIGRGVPRVTAVEPRVVFDTESSATATVVEVYAHDAVGLLFRVTGALAELDLDIRSAKVQTLGSEVVDAFYVTGRGGEKVTDPVHLAEVSRALIHAITTA
jgi:[protein-PII] uridylyltransferase